MWRALRATRSSASACSETRSPAPWRSWAIASSLSTATSPPSRTSAPRSPKPSRPTPPTARPLRALHIGRYEVVFNTIGDLDASILCTLALRELGVHRIVAKVNSTQQARVLTRLGVEEILFPERDMGQRIARQVSAGFALGAHAELSPDAALAEIEVPAVLLGRSLADAQLRRRFGVTVVAVRRPSGEPGTRVRCWSPRDPI